MAMSSSTARSPQGNVQYSSSSKRLAGDGRDLPRQSPDRQAIGPVGRDLHLQHLVGDGEVVDEQLAGLPLLGQHHDARALGRQAQLGLGQDHPRPTARRAAWLP